MKSYLLKIVALFIVSVSISLAATPCKNATLKGRYVALTNGTQDNDAEGPQEFAPFNTVAAIRFDGRGHFIGQGMASMITRTYQSEGVYSESWAITEYQSEGTYVVSKDCTVRINEDIFRSSIMPYSQIGILANGGAKIFAIPENEGGKNFSLVYEKQ